MNPPFDVNTSSALAFDLTLHSTIHSHLSSLSDHLQTLSHRQSRIHPLSKDQPQPEANVNTDLLTLSASLQNYHATISQLVQPLNGEPMVIGAERFIARLKEHASFISRLEARKRAIRHVKDEIGKIELKPRGIRKDLRFTAQRIESLVKELGYAFIYSSLTLDY